MAPSVPSSAAPASLHYEDYPSFALAGGNDRFPGKGRVFDPHNTEARRNHVKEYIYYMFLPKIDRLMARFRKAEEDICRIYRDGRYPGLQASTFDLAVDHRVWDWYFTKVDRDPNWTYGKPAFPFAVPERDPKAPRSTIYAEYLEKHPLEPLPQQAGQTGPSTPKPAIEEPAASARVQTSDAGNMEQLVVDTGSGGQWQHDHAESLQGQRQQAQQGRSHPAEETTGRQSEATRRAELENLVQQLRTEVQGLADQKAGLEAELADQKRQHDVRIAMLTDQMAQQKEEFEREISSFRSERVGHFETQNAINLLREEVRGFRQVAVEVESQGQGAVLSQGFQELSQMAADFPLVPQNQQQFRLANVASMIAPYLEGQWVENLRDFLQRGRTSAWYCIGDVVRNGSAVQHELNPSSPNCRSHKSGNCLLILVENRDGVRRLNFLEPK